MTLHDYQTTQLNEIFDIETIENSLNSPLTSLTPQEEIILEFIVRFPDEQFIELQNIFSMQDHLIIELVITYGTESSDYEEMKRFKQLVKSH